MEGPYINFETSVQRSAEKDEVSINFTFTAPEMEISEFGSKLAHILLTGNPNGNHPAVVISAIWDMYKNSEEHG